MSAADKAERRRVIDNNELRQMRAAYQRQLTWAPPHVHDELRDSRICATTYQQDAILWRAEADLLPSGSPQRTRADIDVAAAEQLAGYFHARVEHLDLIAGARLGWHRDTEPARVRHELAGDELARRGLPRDPQPEPVAEALSLFTPPHQPRSTESQPATKESTASRDHGSDAGPSASIDANQEPLFHTSRNPEALAASGPLRHHDHVPATAGRTEQSLGQARRHAEITTALRAAHQHWRQMLQQIDDTAATPTSDHRYDQAEIAYYTRSRTHTHQGRDLAHDHAADDDDLGILGP